MGEINKVLYFRIIIFMMMASNFLPIVFNNLPPIIRSHHLWTLLWGLSLFLFEHRVFFHKIFTAVIIYGLFILLSILILFDSIDEWNIQMLITEYYQIIIGVSVYIYFSLSRDYLGYAKVTLWTTILIAITALLSIVSSIIDPMYARNIAGVAGFTSVEKRELVLSFERYGGGSYSTAIAFMLLIPVVLFLFKNTKIRVLRYLSLLIFVLFIFALLRMQIFANIILSVFVTFISLTKVEKIKKRLITIIVISLCFLMIPKLYYVNAIEYASSYFSSDSETYNKLNDLALFIELGEQVSEGQTGTADRMERYYQLWENFKESPLLGCFFNSGQYANGYFDNAYDYGYIIQVEGTHLHWMNKLTITGVMGLSLFLWILYSTYKEVKHSSSTRFYYYYLLGFSVFLAYGFIKTILGRDAWYSLLIILPGFFYIYKYQRLLKFN